MKTFIAKDGELRLYARVSSSSTLKMYCKVLFANSDFTGPLGRNRPEETLVLDRMKIDGNTHYIQGSDSVIADPLPFSFSIRSFDRKPAWEVVNWVLNNRSLGSPNKIPLTTKGTTSMYGYDGTRYTTNNFTDSQKMCYNIELKYTADTNVGGGIARSLLLKYGECLFNAGDCTVNEAEDSLTLNFSGMVYGSIDYASADFSAGTLTNALST